MIDLTDSDVTAEISTNLDEKPAQLPLGQRLARPEAADFVASMLAGAAPAIVLRELLGWHGILGTALWGFAFFVLTYYLLQRSGNGPQIAFDRVVTLLVWTVSSAVVAVLSWMILYVAVKAAHILTPSFFVHDMSGVGPLDKGGGVKAAIIGSAEQVGLAVIVVVPLAVLTAVYLNEIKGRMANVVRFIVNALAGLPSVVAGLIVYTTWVSSGHGFSGLAGSLSLIILMLPTVTRTSEEVLRTVPDTLREASLALGAPQWKVVSKVVLRTGLPGLTTAVILGTALGAGETAPLLLTTSFATNTNTNLLHGPQASLPFFIENYITQPENSSVQRGFGAALVLLILILALFVLARYAGTRSARRLGRRI